MMTSRLLLVAWTVSCLIWSSRGESVACELDLQCQSGFYCVPELFVCRRCLECDQLEREPPAVPTHCVKSVAECGPCTRGLVDEVRGDVSQCVSVEGGAPFPLWAAVALALALAVLVAGAALIYYMLRNNLLNVMSIKTLTSTSVSPSAPEQPPPPYYTVPYAEDPERGYHRRDDTEDESLMAFTKPPRQPSDIRDTRDTRGTDGRQAATPYNNPDYVRVPPVSEPPAAAPVRAPSPLRPEAHDDDTAQSDWTPDAAGDSATNTMELSSLLAAARRTELLRDTRRPARNGPGGSGGGAGGGVQAFFINIQQNMLPDTGAKLTL